jgi:thioredoxin-related protein
MGLLLPVRPVMSAEPVQVQAPPKLQGKVLGGIAVEHPAWFKESFLDIGADLGEAGEAGKHLILYFYLNACPYCHRMLEESFKAQAMAGRIQQHFDVIALNIKGDREVALNAKRSLSEKDLAQELKVLYTPTILFMTPDNQVVARVNGYRSVEDFSRVLDYVEGRHYKAQPLAAWLAAHQKQNYSLLPHPLLEQQHDLAALKDRPLALLFENEDCIDCAALHSGHLADPRVQALLKRFHFVRLNSASDAPIIDPQGKRTTARQYSAQLELSYFPSLLLFAQDEGQMREIMRIQSRLYGYHFREILRYVGEGFYKSYPKSFFDYLNVRTQELRDAGQDVDVGEGG